MKKTLLIIIAVILTIGVVGLAGVAVAQSIYFSNEEELTGDPISENDEEKEEPNNEVEEDYTIDVVYTGQIDSNSIETMLGENSDEYVVFRLCDELKENIQTMGIETGTALTITYELNEHDQKVALDIVTKDEDKEAQENNTIDVVYTGQIDSNSIETMLGENSDEYVVFRLCDELKENIQTMGIETGTALTITYELNEHDQKVALDIEKK